MSGWVVIAGLVLDVLGVAVIASAAMLRKQRAVDLGVTRQAGDTLEENLRLPAVRHLRAQSRRTVVGLALIGLGFVLRIIGNWP